MDDGEAEDQEQLVPVGLGEECHLILVLGTVLAALEGWAFVEVAFGFENDREPPLPFHFLALVAVG